MSEGPTDTPDEPGAGAAPEGQGQGAPRAEGAASQGQGAPKAEGAGSPKAEGPASPGQGPAAPQAEGAATPKIDGPKLKPGKRGIWNPAEGSEFAQKIAGAPGVEEASKVRKEAWDALGKMGRTKERIAQNVAHSGILEKGMRAGGALLGVALAYKGAKQIVVTPEPQEGQEPPSFISRILIGGAKLVGGAALTIFSLAKGGEGRALATSRPIGI